MSDFTTRLSQDTFDRLIARASELDEQGNARIDLALAREIALELGISAVAWDAAVKERAQLRHASVAHSNAAAMKWPLVLLAGGLAAGSVMGGARGGDLVLGSLLICVSLAWVATRTLRHSSRAAQVDLAAWWLGVPVGIMLGFGEFLTDPLWFAGLSWAATAFVGASIPRLLRRLRATAANATAPTA
jgi:hypothetical protein